MQYFRYFLKLTDVSANDKHLIIARVPIYVEINSSISKNLQTVSCNRSTKNRILLFRTIIQSITWIPTAPVVVRFI